MNREERRAFAKENGVPMPPAEQQQMQVSPVPVSTTVAVAQTATDTFVVMQFQTPQGVNAFFLSIDHAKAMIAELEKATLIAPTGLVVASELP